MVGACLVMIAVGFALAFPACSLTLRLGRRMGLLDAAGREAHKEAKPAVPNVGGVAVFWAVALPVTAIMAGVWVVPEPWWARLGVAGSDVAAHLPGLRASTAVGGTLLGALAVMHVVGLIDDRRALGPWVKLGVQAVAAAALATSGGSRVLEALDTMIPGGFAVSLVITVLWVVAITNAFNFLDNMDGLSAGVAGIIAGVYLAATLLSGQWFIAALCALLLGALLAFLWFNKPPARLYLGDGGSLVVGLLLAFISIRTTYFIGDAAAGAAGAGAGEAALAGGAHWYGVFVPVVVMAVPMYDLVSVSILRVRAGRSPMAGDRNHFSHRLVKLGLSRGEAVAVIHLATLATALGGVMLGRLGAGAALLVVSQTAAVIATLALLEHAALRRAGVKSDA